MSHSRARTWWRLLAVSLLGPGVVLGLSLAHLALRATSAVSVIAANLPTPPNSSGQRVVDLVHATPQQGRIYRVELEAGSGSRARRLADGRLRLQLASAGKTRILLVLRDGASGSRLRGLLDVLRGRGRLAIVPDQGWIDLGPIPDKGETLRALVIGLLPGPFGVAELEHPDNGDSARLRVSRLDTGTEAVVSTAPRYQIIRRTPLGLLETLARLTFFLRASSLPLGAAGVSLVLLLVGWRLLARSWASSGIALLTVSVALLHATLSPPLQGADETSHVGTLEWLLWNPGPERKWIFPRSISLTARELELDRVQFHPEEALALDGVARQRLMGFARLGLEAEARELAPQPPAAGIQVVGFRGPLFFQPFLALAPAFRAMPILDRVAAYRLTATAWGLLLFLAGLGLLRWAGLSEQVSLLYGAVFLTPYVVGVVASCSNYGPAIGFGFLLAASALAAVLAGAADRRRAATGILLAGAWIGATLWPDFFSLAVVASSLAAARLLVVAVSARSTRGSRGRAVPLRRRSVIAGLGAASATVTALVVWWSFPVVDERIPTLLLREGQLPALAARLLVASSPAALLTLAAVVRWNRRDLPPAARERGARLASVGLAVLVIAMFLATPHTMVPYERVFLPLPELVRAHLASFWSGNLAWDQDRLGWKFLFGAFGWHDALYPDLVYAVARWALVALIVALPTLTVGFASRRPVDSALLLLIAGGALSLALASLLVRHAMGTHPHGRFALPYLGLALLPVLVQIEAPGRERVLRRVLLGGIVLHIWTAIVVLGDRYFIPG